MANSDCLTRPLSLSRQEIGRIFSKVRVCPETGCWIWTGGKTAKGYGRFLFRGKLMAPHRLVFAWLETPLPPSNEKDLHHTCHNPSCVNPSHCELVTKKQHYHKHEHENGAGVCAINRQKTCCPKCGGEYVKDCRGRRYCPACRREYQQKLDREHYAAHRESILERQRAYRAAKRGQ